ncbi:MAG: DNA repair protein RecO [Ignavibacteria bacterium]|nr:DNA repair protein RecO [Ignavibacteria bacterium]
MAIVKTEALILKCDNYRETSKIVTFYSKTYGKLKGIAKGVRNTKSKWGGALQSLSYLNIILYFKENRTLHLISGAEYVNSLKNIHCDHEKLETSYRIVELINNTTAERQENIEIFNLLIDTLIYLDCATKNYVNLLFNFEFKLLRLLGFAVDIEDLFKETVANPAQNQYFYTSRLNPGEVKTIKLLLEGNFNSLMSLNISKLQEKAIDGFFENYFKTHFDHIGFLKTKKVFDSKEMFI